jgi:hypothetical protein
VVRTDSAAATHELTAELRAVRIAFLMGFDLTETIRRAILGLPESAWRPAIRQDGQVREGAWVAEITDRLDLSCWPAGSRVIVRRERPHPGAQLSFTDHDGHRFLATLTDLDGDPAWLECLHRARASAEDRIRNAKQTGLENLPFRDFDHNAVWLEISLIAQDLIAWTQQLALDGELARCEPKDAALPAAAHRRPARVPRPPRHPAPATHLALGRGAGRRVRPPRGAATTGALTCAQTAENDHRHPGPTAGLTAVPARHPDDRPTFSRERPRRPPHPQSPSHIHTNPRHPSHRSPQRAS